MRVTYAVRSIMTKDLVSVAGTASVNEAMRLMAGRDIGSLLVKKDGEMVGILTERDVLKKCCPDNRCAAMKAAEIMSSPLITIDGDAAIGEAADLMAEKKIRRLVVTVDGKIQGIITERDVMRATLDVFKTLSEAII